MASQLTGYNAFFAPASDILTTLTTLLSLAESSPQASALLGARTHATMLPLSFQFSVACTTVDKIISRVCGVDPQGWPYDDASLDSYPAIRARLAAAQALLRGADEELVNMRCKEGTISLPNEDGSRTDTPVSVWLSAFALPNMYFHLGTAYNILRGQGLELGKGVYLGAFNETLSGNPGLRNSV